MSEKVDNHAQNCSTMEQNADSLYSLKGKKVNKRAEQGEHCHPKKDKVF